MKRGVWAFVALVSAACATLPGDSGQPLARADPTSDRIAKLLREVPLVDGHNDLMIHYVACPDDCPRDVDRYDIRANAAGHTDIKRWRIGGLGGQLLNAGWLEHEPDLEGTLKGFALARRLIDRHSSDLTLGRTAADIRSAHRGGRIAVLLALEDPGRLGVNEATVRRLAEEGLRANVLAYDGASALADGHAGPAKHNGLSPLGRDMVRWMQSHGILVDLSHASVATMHDVLDRATAPVFFSHSSAAALCDVPRNVPDDVLRRLPANDGLVMVSFVPYFTSQAFAEWMARGDAFWTAALEQQDGNRTRARPLMLQWERENPPPRVTLSDVADHIEHIRRVAGIDHVGLGADFDGIAFTIPGLDDVSTYPELLKELVRRGWSDHDLRKLVGENFLRVLDAADGVSPDR